VKTHRGLLGILILLLLTGTVGGCHIFSWVVAAFVPKPKIAAEYKLPPHQRLLVFPDSTTCPLERPQAQDILANQLNDQLQQHDVSDKTIAYDRLHHLRHPLGLYRPVSVAEAARKLGADLVLYVSIREFRVKDGPGDISWKGVCRVRVRVTDAAGKQLWPDDGMDGREIVVETGTSVQEDASYGDRLTEELATKTAERIAQLFYSHR